jgi:bifunctional DNA-binding transcriptional regulator/antitoxin component of YhaV-PrlF toxin-antitoxin module
VGQVPGHASTLTAVPSPLAPALDALHRVGRRPAPARWRHWVVEVQRSGRVTLPPAARRIADGLPAVRAVSRDDALVLRRDGLGAAITLDGRGRLILPVWLRRLAAPAGSVLVAARRPDASVVVIAPVGSLDALVEGVCGEVG